MHLNCLGTFTFDDDSELEKGLKVVKKKIQEMDDSFLTMEHISPLGLHVTVKHSGNATSAQKDACEDILKTLAQVAYSGYVDMTVDRDNSQRFHAKEIAPKEISVEDIASD